MSAATDATSETPMHTVPPAGVTRTRPFFWSVRRELWENHAIWIAPLVVAAIVIFGFSVGLFTPHSLTNVNRTSMVSHAKTVNGVVVSKTVSREGGGFAISANADADATAQADPAEASKEPVAKVAKPTVMTPAQRLQIAVLPYDFLAVAMLVTMFLVAVFYCLGAMHNERRDRSILFWKSLPVPDLTTVLAKATIPMAVLPLVTVVLTLATQLVMLLLNSAEWTSHSRDLAALWSRIPLGEMSVVLLYGTITLTLWWAPVYAWLLLVSVWARRAPFLWAVLPPLGLALAEKLAFNTTNVASMLSSRIMGTYEDAFVVPAKGAFRTPGAIATITISQIDAGKFLSTPGLWIGLIVAAGLVVATIWLRRNREPL